MANFAVPNWHRNFEPARYVFVIDVRQEQLTAARNELADMLRQKVCQGNFRMDQSLHRDGSVPVPTKIPKLLDSICHLSMVVRPYQKGGALYTDFMMEDFIIGTNEESVHVRVNLEVARGWLTQALVCSPKSCGWASLMIAILRLWSSCLHISQANIATRKDLRVNVQMVLVAWRDHGPVPSSSQPRGDWSHGLMVFNIGNEYLGH